MTVTEMKAALEGLALEQVLIIRTWSSDDDDEYYEDYELEFGSESGQFSVGLTCTPKEE